MFCYECGKEILDGSKFCPYCGTSLLNAVNNVGDDNNTDEIQNHEENAFCMTIQDVFNISGRGTVVTGTVESGELHIGQNVKILDYGDTVYSVTGIEMKGSLLNSAKIGESIGVLLRGLEKTNNIKGKKLVSQDDEQKSDDAPDYEKIFGFAGQMSSSGLSSPQFENESVHNSSSNHHEYNATTESVNFGYTPNNTSNVNDNECSYELLQNISNVSYYKQPKTVYDATGPLKIFKDHLEFDIVFGGGVGNAFGLVGMAVARSNAKKQGSSVIIKYSDIKSIMPWSNLGAQGMCLELNDGSRPCFVKYGQSVSQAMFTIKNTTGK